MLLLADGAAETVMGDSATEIITAVMEHWFVIIVVAMVLAWGVSECVKYLSNNWRRSQEARYQARTLENEAKLKALMVQRGMPSDEIARVLGTGTQNSTNSATRLEELMIEQGIEADQIKKVLEARHGNTGGNETQIVEKLAEGGYEAADIAGILTAARVNHEIDDDAVRLIEVMVDNEMEGDDMQRVLRARRTDKVVSYDLGDALKLAGISGKKAKDVLRAVRPDDEDHGQNAPTRSA